MIVAEHGDGKLIPPGPVLVEDLEAGVEQKLRAAITERILREARLEEQVAAAVAAIRMPSGSELAERISASFERAREQSWRDQIEAEATGIATGTAD